MNIVQILDSLKQKLFSREYRAIALGVAVFVLGSVVLTEALFTGQVLAGVLLALLAGLETGWCYYDASYWRRTHAAPFRKVWQLCFGTTKGGEKALGASWLLLMCSLLVSLGIVAYLSAQSFGWVDTKSGWLENSLVGQVFMGIGIVFSIVGLLTVVDVTASAPFETGSGMRRLAWQAPIVAVVAGCTMPLIFLLCNMTAVGIVVTGSVLLVVGIANLAVTKHLLVVTSGIVVGSLSSLAFGGVEGNLILRLVVGIVAGFVGAEIIRQFGRFLTLNPYGQALNRELQPGWSMTK
jgi:hypothetical protein